MSRLPSDGGLPFPSLFRPRIVESIPPSDGGSPGLAHRDEGVDLVQRQPVFGLEMDAQVGHAAGNFPAKGACGGSQVRLAVLNHGVPLGVGPIADVAAEWRSRVCGRRGDRLA